MVSALVWTLCLLAFLGLFAWQIYGRLHILPLFRRADRFDRIPERIKQMLVGAIGQMKFFNPGQDQPAGIIHALVFWGFLILALQVLTMFLRGWAPDAYLEKVSETEARATRDYTARELDTQVGESLTMHLELNEWLWVENKEGECGWVPKETINVGAH